MLAVATAALVALWIPAGDRAASRTMPPPAIGSADLPGNETAVTAMTPPVPQDPSALVARTVNALSPFAPGTRTPAAPFVLAGGLADRQRAVDCLAAAEYYEAGTGAADQRAVAQVILNRVRHRAFPDTVCGVVFQGSERSTGCQFTFTCDGSLARRRPAAAAWTNARLVAEEMLSGRVEPAVGLATHYHTDWVMPSWNREMDKIAAVKTHLFFQWRGDPGRPAAFAASHPGTEPRVALIQTLSPAHRAEGWPFASAEGLSPPGAPAPADAALAAARILPGAAAAGVGGERLPDKASAPEQDDFLVTLSAADGPDSFLRRAEQSCAGRDRCRFIGWTDPARRATGLPMPGSSVDAISFVYVRRIGRAESAQWNCAEFSRADRTQCLRRGG